jgi:hypothetical protein
MHSSRESVARVITMIGLCLCAALASWRLIDGAEDPRHFDGYRYRNTEGPIEWVYPAREVGGWVFAFAIQAVLASLLIARARPTAAPTCAVLAVLTFGATFVCGAMGMHAPLPLRAQAGFTLIATGWLVVGAALCGLAALADKRDRDDCTP